jgi:hypothetical protein
VLIYLTPLVVSVFVNVSSGERQVKQASVRRCNTHAILGVATLTQNFLKHGSSDVFVCGDLAI